MSASKLYPNIYNGQERNWGVFGPAKQTSANSPDFRGRIYLVGVGWYFLSGWKQQGPYGEYFRLDPQEMPDDKALIFCKPKPPRRGKPAAELPTNESPPHQRNGAETPENDIPF